MTQDEVLSALHKVVAENMNYTTWTVSTPHLVALVKLAIEHEREACAKLCETLVMGKHCAAAIRSRGENT